MGSHDTMARHTPSLALGPGPGTTQYVELEYSTSAQSIVTDDEGSDSFKSQKRQPADTAESFTSAYWNM